MPGSIDPELLLAMEKLKLEGKDLATESLENKLIEESGPSKLFKARKPTTQSIDDILKELETDTLLPSPTFNSTWLNRLQKRWDFKPDMTDLYDIAPTHTRSTIRFTREGLQGRVSGYQEVAVPASSATAKNSTSITRRPAARADFVRGAAGFFPFAPGGLDAVDAFATLDADVQAAEESLVTGKQSSLDRIINFNSDGGLLRIPPGFSRGIDFSGKKSKEVTEAQDEVQHALEEENAAIQPDVIPELETKDEESDQETQFDEIDDFLPDEFPSLGPRNDLLMMANKKGYQWAHVVNVNKEFPNFHDLVPDMARVWPFELDVFQKEAVYHLERGDSVFVAAHTSAGKTVVAEYAIALAAKHMTKAIYTSPIKALSNQKFRDFRTEFDDVGILTGDVQINPEASCLIMTTEILRSMLYRGADLIRDVEFVIFDEVHYVNDQERGVVWEEVIIMLPEHVTLILLSATVPNTFEFASWVGRTKKKDIWVISTPKRPVPLEHYLWSGQDKFKIVDANKRFLEPGWKAADNSISGRDKIKSQKEIESAQAGRGGSQGGRGRGRGNDQRGGRGQGGRGGGGRGSNSGTGNIARGGRGGFGRGGARTTPAQDKTAWVSLVQHLRKFEMLPACIFVFSKKRCESNADALNNQDFCNAAEKSLTHMFIEKSLTRLKEEDRSLPQILKLRDLLSRGVAVHHGGLLPIMKEVVEILFSRGLVKVLFATETFAMGLNLPTRTVVFCGYRKHDGKDFRDLLPGEYTQMAGRAGRRGLDSVGYVMIATPGRTEAPTAMSLKKMILGEPTKLRSQFRLTYNMILNLLRVEALRIEEMIKRSFSENATQALLPEQEKQVQLSQANLDSIKREPCEICDQDMEIFHNAVIEYKKLTLELHTAVLTTPVGKRLFSAKKLVVYRQPNGARTAGIIVKDGFLPGSIPYIQVFEISATGNKRHPSDLLPFLPQFCELFRKLPKAVDAMTLKVLRVPLADIECVTNTSIRTQSPLWYLAIQKEGLKFYKDELASKYNRPWSNSIWNETDWSRVKEMHVGEIITKRSKQVEILGECVSPHCQHFLKHFEMEHDEWKLKEDIKDLKRLMSDQNLQLLPDYEQRIQVLKELGFVDDLSRVQLKGKVACEIHSADELVMTELILENVLSEYEPEEIVALLSAFVFQEKTDITPRLTPRLETGQKAIIAIAEKVNNFQILHQVIQSSEDSNDFASSPRFGLAEVVYEWARGMSFNRITNLTDVMEGTIVRTISRLDETCREVKNAAKLIGDPTLHLKMEKAQEMIKRDVIFAASLYM